MTTDNLAGLRPEDIPQIELRPLSSLSKYARNARTHSPGQVAQLQALFREFGWTNAVLVDDMGIVAGHGRCMAAEGLYQRGEQVRFPNGTLIPLGYVPVVDCTGWTPEQRRAYILADNRSAMSAGWDEELLAMELKELDQLGYDLSLTAFDEGEIDDLLATLIEPPTNDKDPEDIPPVPVEPVSVMGDIWVCGPHRVMCGDSLSLESWGRLMGKDLADLCITDPPYNVAYESKLAGKIKNDDMGDGEFRKFLRAAYDTMFAVMQAGAPIYVAHADTEGLNFRGAFRDAGFKLSGCLIWRKNSLVLGRSDYQWQHEPILYGWKPGAAHRWYGGRKLTTVVEWGDDGPIRRLPDGRWSITVGDSVLIVDGDATIEEAPGTVIFHEKPSRSELHPTTKPVGLWEKLMRPSARAGDVVIDPFSGSGTTLIACERLGMKARVCDLDPKFVDVAVRRWEMLTGLRAVHAVTGEPFPREDEQRAAVPDLAPADGLTPDDEELF